MAREFTDAVELVTEELADPIAGTHFLVDGVAGAQEAEPDPLLLRPGLEYRIRETKAADGGVAWLLESRPVDS